MQLKKLPKEKEKVKGNNVENGENYYDCFLNKETRNKWDNLFGAGKLPNSEEFIIIFFQKL